VNGDVCVCASTARSLAFNHDVHSLSPSPLCPATHPPSHSLTLRFPRPLDWSTYAAVRFCMSRRDGDWFFEKEILWPGQVSLNQAPRVLVEQARAPPPCVRYFSPPSLQQQHPSSYMRRAGHMFCTMQSITFCSFSGQGRCDYMLSRPSHVNHVRPPVAGLRSAGSDPTVVGGQHALAFVAL